MKHLHIYALILISAFSTSCDEKRTQGKKIIITSETKGVVTPHGPKGITRNVMQDKKGNIWIAAFDGIFRYDGNSFTNVTSKVSSSRFFSVLEDRRRNLWFGSIGSGVYYFDGKSFTNFTTSQGLINNEVGSIYEDKKGDIWIGGADGLWRYDGGKFTNYTRDFIGHIYEDRKGNIWTSSQKAHEGTCILSRYDAKSLADAKPTVTEILSKYNGNKGMIFGILEANDGSIWFGTMVDGVRRYDGQTITDFKDKLSVQLEQGAVH